MTASAKTFVISFLTILILNSCAKSNFQAGIPSCIEDRIKQMQSAPKTNPGGSVWQYQFEGRTVYYIPAQCCDFPSVLLDSDCNIICSPDGGFSAKGDGRCANFLEKRSGEKLIWKDSR